MAAHPDVLILGGGVIGLTTAYYLAREGVSVSVLDRGDLGRQASWPAGRYSTIAGFVEIGESLEDAVAREVREETGIEVHDIEYHSSQPWPFPSNFAGPNQFHLMNTPKCSAAKSTSERAVGVHLSSALTQMLVADERI